ncbi:alpha/beta hydrolase [Longispora sp. K20-0274]|uniref:RBBP9/YdeN family alpha/beta hydrolase n=1 Tax=Longispora sp. K20-0274 TaxID=3088255 RepID=UPI00399B1980
MTSRNAVIFHGTGGSPGILWFPWLGRQLTARGYDVDIPHYPGINVDPVDDLVPTILAGHRFDRDTVLVGHSGGAALLLALLEDLDVTVARAILVAGYCTEPNTEREPVLRKGYDWSRIRAHVRDLYFVNSTNDPYGCDDGQGRAMFDRLGGTLIVREEGHFGDHDQPYPTFELVDRLIG